MNLPEGGNLFTPLLATVRTVNNTQRRFIAFDHASATNIFRRDQFREERIPCAQFLQCFFRINASRGHVRITNREATAIQQRPVGFAVDGEIFLLAGSVLATTRLLPSSVWREAVSIAFFINRIIHPFLIGRNKQIRRRTRFNLTGRR